MSGKWMVVCGAALALAASAARADTLVVCTEASPDALNANLSTANTTYRRVRADRRPAGGNGDRRLEADPGAWPNPGPFHRTGCATTFKLRHGVKWQSNAAFKPTRELNADDVVFTFNRMLDKNNRWYKVGGGVYPAFASFIEPSLKAVSKISDDTVVFELKAPSAPLISALSVQSFSILSAEYAAAMDKAGTPDQLDLNPIGTGPFQLVQYQKDSLIRFRANPDFWGAKGAMPERAAKVDNLVFAITADPSVRFAKLRANECQIARYPNPADLDAMRATPGVTVPESTIASLSYLAFRTDKKPFDDVRVREALATAVDLDSLVKAVYQGSGTPAAALVSAGFVGPQRRREAMPL